MIELGNSRFASVAQSVVHLTRNEKVACSSQVTSSTKTISFEVVFIFINENCLINMDLKTGMLRRYSHHTGSLATVSCRCGGGAWTAVFVEHTHCLFWKVFPNAILCNIRYCIVHLFGLLWEIILVGLDL